MLRFELDNTAYERDQLKSALGNVKRKVQDKVPAISHVEERRMQLEQINKNSQNEIRNLQD